MSYVKHRKYDAEEASFFINVNDSDTKYLRVRKTYQWIPLDEENQQCSKYSNTDENIDYLILFSVVIFFFCMIFVAILVVLFDELPM